MREDGQVQKYYASEGAKKIELTQQIPENKLSQDKVYGRSEKLKKERHSVVIYCDERADRLVYVQSSLGDQL